MLGRREYFMFFSVVLELIEYSYGAITNYTVHICFFFKLGDVYQFHQQDTTVLIDSAPHITQF